MKRSTLLVPYDFTPVADSAVKDAITIAKQTRADVLLLHVVKNTKDMQAANTKLEAVIKTLDQTEVGIKHRIEAGSIFDDIGRVAEEVKASVIVMGTHGAKGMQKVFGSFAIKVITSTNVPFMVVQEKLISRDIGKIVLPVTASKESLQILTSTANLAKALNATVHVVYETKSEVAMQRKIKNYAQIALQQLAEQGVNDAKAFKLQGKGSYQEQILDFSKRHGADLISVAYYTEKVFAQFDSFAQDLITNKDQIPTLIIKTVDSTVGYF
jgi:nucleotide-binding universal stress UspA family protein